MLLMLNSYNMVNVIAHGATIAAAPCAYFHSKERRLCQKKALYCVIAFDIQVRQCGWSLIKI